MLIFCLTFVVFCSDTGNTTLENGSGQVKQTQIDDERQL